MTGKLLKYILTLFSLLFHYVINGQTNVDSLIRVTEKEGIHDSVKIKLFGDISWELMASDINKALVYANKELQLATKTNRKADIAQAESDVGNIYNRKSSFDTALIHYNLALNLRKELKQDVKCAGIYTNIATVYMRQNKFEESLEMNFNALKLFEKVGDEYKQALVLGNIGNIYNELKQVPSAEKFFKQSLVLSRKNKIALTEGNVLVNFGTIKFEHKQYDSALLMLTQAETILTSINALYNLGAVYNDIGGIYMELKQYDKAMAYFEKGLKNREAVEDVYGTALSMLKMGQLESERNNYSKAIDYLKKSADIFLQLKNYIHLKQAYGLIAKTYKNSGDFSKSLDYFELYAQYKDSVFTTTNAEKMAEMETKYETEKKDLELAKQKAELLAAGAEQKRQRTFIFSLLGVLILVLVSAYLIYSRNKIKAKAKLDAEMAKQKELRSKAVIEAEEKERRRIAQDLHDGVGQTLSAAKLNLSGLESKLKLETDEQSLLLKNALELVNDSVKEVRAVSHNMMPNTLIKLGLASAVREFITKIGSIPNLKIDLQIVGLDDRLDNTVETVLYRVIQEVVSNIIKHANANQISMQLIKHEGELTVMIEDNGVGFDKKKVNDFEGIGLKNIISRVEFLNGHVEFDSTEGQGTTVVIEVPLV